MVIVIIITTAYARTDYTYKTYRLKYTYTHSAGAAITAAARRCPVARCRFSAGRRRAHLQICTECGLARSLSLAPALTFSMARARARYKPSAAPPRPPRPHAMVTTDDRGIPTRYKRYRCAAPPDGEKYEEADGRKVRKNLVESSRRRENM